MIVGLFLIIKVNPYLARWWTLYRYITYNCEVVLDVKVQSITGALVDFVQVYYI